MTSLGNTGKGLKMNETWSFQIAIPATPERVMVINYETPVLWQILIMVSLLCFSVLWS